MSKDKQVSPVMRELSSYIAGALKRKLPAEVSEQAKIHLVDTFAAMISGSRLLPGKCAIAYVKPFSGTSEAGVIGTRIVTFAAPILGRKRSQTLMSALFDIEDIKNARALRKLYSV